MAEIVSDQSYNQWILSNLRRRGRNGASGAQCAYPRCTFTLSCVEVSINSLYKKFCDHLRDAHQLEYDVEREEREADEREVRRRTHAAGQAIAVEVSAVQPLQAVAARHALRPTWAAAATKAVVVVPPRRVVEEEEHAGATPMRHAKRTRRMVQHEDTEPHDLLTAPPQPPARQPSLTAAETAPATLLCDQCEKPYEPQNAIVVCATCPGSPSLHTGNCWDAFHHRLPLRLLTVPHTKKEIPAPPSIVLVPLAVAVVGTAALVEQTSSTSLNDILTSFNEEDFLVHGTYSRSRVVEIRKSLTLGDVVHIRFKLDINVVGKVYREVEDDDDVPQGWCADQGRVTCLDPFKLVWGRKTVLLPGLPPEVGTKYQIVFDEIVVGAPGLTRNNKNTQGPVATKKVVRSVMGPCRAIQEIVVPPPLAPVIKAEATMAAQSSSLLRGAAPVLPTCPRFSAKDKSSHFTVSDDGRIVTHSGAATVDERPNHGFVLSDDAPLVGRNNCDEAVWTVRIHRMALWIGIGLSASVPTTSHSFQHKDAVLFGANGHIFIGGHCHVAEEGTAPLTVPLWPMGALGKSNGLFKAGAVVTVCVRKNQLSVEVAGVQYTLLAKSLVLQGDVEKLRLHVNLRGPGDSVEIGEAHLLTQDRSPQGASKQRKSVSV